MDNGHVVVTWGTISGLAQWTENEMIDLINATREGFLMYTLII